MSLQKQLRVLNNLMHVELPHYIIFYVTSQCNARCPHCFYWQQIESFDKSKELTLEETQKIANNFENLEQVSLTGGEPFLNDELPKICEIWSKTCNVSFFTIPTNGILSKRIAEKAEEIITRCPSTHLRIGLSLDGVGEQHDRLRGIKGNFANAMNTYAMLDPLREKYSNISIDVATVLQNGNQDNIVEIFEWVEKNLNVDNHMLLYPRGKPKEPRVKNVSLENYRKAHEFLKNRKMKDEHRPFSAVLRSVFEVSRDVIAQTVEEERMIVPCTAGKRLIIIGERGDVYPCEILSECFGNLRDVNYDIRKLLFSQHGNDIKKFIKDTDCHCTFECAVNTNVVFSPRLYPKLAVRAVENIIG